MDHDIIPRLVERLIGDYGLKRNGDWLQQGRCPQCGKKELFCRADQPFWLHCGRKNKCSFEAKTKELYPDLFANFNKRFQPTEQNPNATADAYLALGRGFDLTKIRGWYEQGRFWHANGDRGTATVRFYLEPERQVYMERLIEEVTLTDPATGEKDLRKAHFKGSHKGLWWAPPGQVIQQNDEVWLVEGCLDAIALALNGVKACAVLSCVNYPTAALEGHKATRGVTWVWALDNDTAGKAWIKKHVARMRAEGLDCAAALSPAKQKQDWNDLHQRAKLTQKDREEYRHHGALLIARTAAEKALLLYEWDERQEFFFEFNSRAYWFGLDLKKYEKAMETLAASGATLDDAQRRRAALREANAIHEIANCWPEFLYYQQNAITDESWYYCRVSFPHDGPPVKNTFTGAQLSSASEFAKRLLSIGAGAVWTGTTTHLDRLKRAQLFNIKTVQTIDFIGYAKEFGCYVFPDLAVLDGRLYEINDEDFFDAGKLSIKSLNQSVNLHINRHREDYQPEWLRALHACFGAKGLVALAFWFGSLFAEQIRALHKSYPFLEVVGEPGSGKSTLIEFLWKLVGRRDYEGFDPSKSTLAARARNFAQVANLPVVLIEADREEDAAKSRKFDWDELKTAYNGRSVRARGMKNSGNETYEPPFKGAIVISQNADVNASEAILQRLVHLNFDKAAHNAATKAAAEKLERWPLENLSHWVIDAALKEKRILEIVREKTPTWESALLALKEIKSVRVAKNHGQLMALVEALAELMGMDNTLIDQAHDCIEAMAIERQQAINQDHPIVQQFWETFDYLNEPGEDGLPRLNHSADPGLIALNLNEYVDRAEYHRQQIPPLLDLKNHLKTSRARRYLDQRTVSSKLKSTRGEPRSVRCWVFKRET